jgi:hypothetical protein
MRASHTSTTTYFPDFPDRYLVIAQLTLVGLSSYFIYNLRIFEEDGFSPSCVFYRHTRFPLPKQVTIPAGSPESLPPPASPAQSLPVLPVAPGL